MNPENVSGKRKKDDESLRPRSERKESHIIPHDPDPLCCCEYINENGERSHLLAFCCDCEALDDSFDRLIQRQPQPAGRYNEILSTCYDRLRIPWLNGARRIEMDIILPMLLLPSLLVLATIGPICTAISFLLMLISLHVIRKLVLYKIKRTKFYCSFTITSFLLSYLVFEVKVTSFLKVTHTEYVSNICLLCLTLALMFYTRKKGAKDTKLALISDKLPSYYYCRTCQFYVNGRDHHCVWLNCCIGRNNKPWFLAAISVGCCWILYTVNLSLTSICHSEYLFRQSFLVPSKCPDLYLNFDTSVSFVTAIYGIIVLILLIIILIHQSRLVWRGMSYLEWKYGKYNPQAASSKPP